MKVLQVAVGVVKNAQDQVLISLRPPRLHQGGLWEFPGGKLERGESIEQALVRELKEELDISVISATPLITVKHQYPEIAVQLHVFLVEQFSGEARSCEGQPFKWVSSAELNRYSFPAANRPIITAAQLPPFYAILDDADESQLLVNLEKILAGGVKLVQARLKNLPLETVKAFVEEAYPLCKQQGAWLLMNSDVVCGELVDSVDGVHLTGRHLMAASKRPKARQWVAASCHNLRELQHAQTIGVDFAVLAPVLATQTHPDTQPLGWAQFTKLVAQVNLPVYALGGLSVSGLNVARQAGGQGVSGIRAFLE